MAQTSYPFSIGPGRLMTDAQWRAMTKRWRGSGVNKGDQNSLVVAAGAGLQVTVASGSAFVQGEFYTNDASLPLAHAAADATFGRLDLVVLEMNLTDINAPLVQAVVVAGTPSGSPALPALTQSSTIYQIPLASVLIPALASSVSTITDYRSWAGYQPRLVDGSGGGTATTSSTSYADIVTMGTPSIYTDGGDIEVTFSGSGSINAAGGIANIAMTIDGGAEVYVGDMQSDSANQSVPFSARHLFQGVAAGWHFLRIRWKVGNAAHTASMNNSRRMIWAEVR